MSNPLTYKSQLTMNWFTTFLEARGPLRLNQTTKLATMWQNIYHINLLTCGKYEITSTISFHTTTHLFGGGKRPTTTNFVYVMNKIDLLHDSLQLDKMKVGKQIQKLIYSILWLFNFGAGQRTFEAANHEKISLYEPI